MKKISTFMIFLFFAFILMQSTDYDAQEGESIDLNRTYVGGETTIFSTSKIAYVSPASNLNSSELSNHLFGDTQFEQVFVTAPAPLNSGLGPVYNNSSCVKCHPSDGRGKFPANDINSFSSFFYRISVPGSDEHGGPVPVPILGLQAQNHALPGFEKEMDFKVQWTEINETLSDGTIVTLRKPIYSFENASQPVPQNMAISPRIAPPIFGSGLLEAIPESNFLSLQDITDTNNDGISGKANYVWNPFSQQMELGRFGWKANTSKLLIQVAAAYHEDMGITNYIFHEDSYSDGLPDDPEISQQIVDKVTFYCQTLAVPAARNVGTTNIEKGYQIFNQIDCAKCHIPKQQTGYSSISALSYQTFYPFTDLLLHDMGEALADNRTDYLANGYEWRTRPLWGIGLQLVVNGHTEFLHDGRARNLTEAILWHGGEAENAKQKFKQLSSQKRNYLLDFLNSL